MLTWHHFLADCAGGVAEPAHEGAQVLHRHQPLRGQGVCGRACVRVACCVLRVRSWLNISDHVVKMLAFSAQVAVGGQSGGLLGGGRPGRTAGPRIAAPAGARQPHGLLPIFLPPGRARQHHRPRQGVGSRLHIHPKGATQQNSHARTHHRTRTPPHTHAHTTAHARLTYW